MILEIHTMIKDQGQDMADSYQNALNIGSTYDVSTWTACLDNVSQKATLLKSQFKDSYVN